MSQQFHPTRKLKIVWLHSIHYKFICYLLSQRIMKTATAAITCGFAVFPKPSLLHRFSLHWNASLITCWMRGRPRQSRLTGCIVLWGLKTRTRTIWGISYATCTTTIYKEQILRKARECGDNLLDGYRVQVLSDLSKMTLDKRRALRPLLDMLREHGISYSWGYPFQLLVRVDCFLMFVHTPADVPGFFAALWIPTVTIRDCHMSLCLHNNPCRDAVGAPLPLCKARRKGSPALRFLLLLKRLTICFTLPLSRDSCLRI